jgi:ABC-type Fe3+-siderophore transport system permease subunit
VPRRPALTLILLSCLLAGTVVLRLCIGEGGHLGWPESDYLTIRMARVSAGVVAGAGLAVAGVMLQALLRNPLAAPELIGASTGAAFGVMLSMVLGGASGIALGLGRGPAAFAGALGALGIVYALGQRRGFVEPVLLVLVGVMISVIFGAGTMLLGAMMPDGGWAAMRWSIGSISEDVPPRVVAVVGGVTVFAIVCGVLLARAMDAAALSEEEATSIGVPLPLLRVLLFVLAGGLTAGVVVIAGPIGFVGLVCPHAVRLLAGPRHGVLIVGAALAGAALVVGADAAVRAIDIGSGRFPIGVFTALIGGPVFIAMLRKHAAAGL